jgi:hypothetical protein
MDDRGNLDWKALAKEEISKEACSLSGLSKEASLSAPLSKYECMFIAVPLSKISYSRFPPRSPLGYVELKKLVLCKG